MSTAASLVSSPVRQWPPSTHARRRWAALSSGWLRMSFSSCTERAIVIQSRRAGIGDGFFHVVHHSERDLERRGRNDLVPQVGPQKAKDVDDGKILQDAFFRHVDHREDGIIAAFSEARKAGAHAERVEPADDIAPVEIAAKQLLLQRRMDVQVNDGRLAVKRCPVQAVNGHSSTCSFVTRCEV